MSPKKTDISKLTVAERAYLKFLGRGGEHGHDMEDWLAAEQEAGSKAKKTTGAKAPAEKKPAAKSPAKKAK